VLHKSVEAKLPSGDDLDKVEKSEQLERYRSTFENVILTNFIEFRLYRDGEQIAEANITSLPEIPERGPLPGVQEEEKLQKLLDKFFSHTHTSIDSALTLAEELAKRTGLMKDIVLEQLENQQKNDKGDILGFYRAFNEYLMDLDEEEFADIYSQTITYGLLTARSRSSGAFTRENAADEIPGTIGILKEIFEYISAGDLPDEMEWVVDEVAHILSDIDVKTLLSAHYEHRTETDPLVHFYETFLEEYDQETRQQKGVYYTPEPVISFINESINKVLRNEFGRTDGLADDDVTILDPAAGTMGFIANATNIALREFTSKYGEGGEKSLLSDHILDNYYGFELLVAAYTIGHLKMAILFEESGYELDDDDRIQLYLTNTLQEGAKDTTLPMLSSIAEESEKAKEVKEDTPILAIVGNPPYSGHSENKSEWINSLIDDYKEGYNLSRRSKWLQDDYVKFIRWSQWKLSEAKEGLLAFITNHGYIENPTFVGMREQLLKGFDQIYVIDLHGSARKNETPPDGGVDNNVFPIEQGVAITFFIKQDTSEDGYADVYHSDLWGSKQDKFDFLTQNDIQDIEWEEVLPREPHYLFAPRDLKLQKKYNEWIAVEDIFQEGCQGIVPGHKSFILGQTPSEIEHRIEEFLRTESEEEARQKFDLSSSTWSYEDAIDSLQDIAWKDQIHPILTNPFDVEYTVYDGETHVRPLREVSKHMVAGDNITLGVARRAERLPFNHAFVTDTLIENHAVAPKNVNNQFPLYRFPEARQNTHTRLDDEAEKETNIRSRLIAVLEEHYDSEVTGEDVFYYTYAILYCPTYRTKYSEFMKTGYPKIPFPQDYTKFETLSRIGSELVELHLLDHETLDSPHVTFSGEGDNEVSQRTGQYNRHYDEENNRLFINKNQYFGPIERDTWEFEIGAKQVLKKWIQQRIGQELSLSEIRKYCSIITSIKKTGNLQSDIEEEFKDVEYSWLPLNISDQQEISDY